AKGKASFATTIAIRHQPRFAQAPQGIERGALWETADGGEQVGVESLPEDGGPVKELLIVLRQGAHPAEDHLMATWREVKRLQDAPPTLVHVEAPCLRRITHELLDDEGVATACVGDQRLGLGMRVEAEDVAQHERDLRAVERREDKLLSEALARKLVSQLIQAPTGRVLVRPVCERNQYWCVQGRPGQKADESVACGVGPAQDLEDE